MAQPKRHLHLTRERVPLTGRRPGEDEPGLFGLALTVRFAGECHPARTIETLFFAQVETAGPVLHLPLDDLDLPQEQEGAGSKTAHRLLDDLLVARRAEREHEGGRVGPARGEPRRCGRQNVVLDGEVLGTRVHLGPVGERIHGLEPDAETADRGQPRVLGGLADPADVADIGFVERLAPVGEPQFVGEEMKDGGARPGPVPASPQRIFGVLQQLVDEVGAVAVAVREEFSAVLADGAPVTAGVLPADRRVVGRHRPDPDAITRAVSSASPASPERAASSQITRRPRRLSSS